MLAHQEQADDLFRQVIKKAEAAQSLYKETTGENAEFIDILIGLIELWHPDLPPPFVYAISFVIRMNRDRLRAN